MASFKQEDVRNTLLRLMPADAFAFLESEMEAVSLPVKTELIASNVATSHACFIETGLASIVVTNDDDQDIEAGHIGREGFAGSHLLLRGRQTPNRTFMQVAGSGIRVPADAVYELISRNEETHELLLRYLQTTFIQVAHSLLATSRYTLHERLARWILMCHDRLSSDDLPLTHDLLALMLGVRRSGVTSELHIIEGMGIIKATRGNIRVLDRQGLKVVARGSYGVPEREYERLIGVRVDGGPSVRKSAGLDDLHQWFTAHN